eukprot:2148499-Alexandrium_andersonii.AAC.1
MSKTARPPGAAGRWRSTGGSQASATGPSKAAGNSGLARPSRCDLFGSGSLRPSRCWTAMWMFCRHEPPCLAACQADRVGSTNGPTAPTVTASTSRRR